MKAELINLENKKVGTIEVPDSVFGVAWKPSLVRQVLVAQMANRRLPWAHTKDRSEVRGGGKKPWRQKGTGRARHGSTRSPIWVGGGKAHGPRNDRDYSQKVNKKAKRTAIFAVLSKKLKDGEVKFMETLALEAPKTSALAKSLAPFKNGKMKRMDILMVPMTDNTNIFKASRNLEKAKALSPEALNVYDLMNYKNILIDEKAVGVIAKHYASSK